MHSMLEEMDFRPRNPLIMLVLFVLFYGLCFGGVLFTFGVKDSISAGLSSLADWLEVIFIVGNYLLIGVFLLFYVVFDAQRFKFSEDGMRVWTWLGPKLHPWNQVQKATLTNHRGGIDLVLNFGGWRTITIPLNSFQRSASLFNEIQRRLPVGVAASEKTVALLTDH